MLAWERDIGTEYSSQQWGSAFRLTHYSTKSTNMREMQQKLTLRWYLTPYRISKIHMGASPLCWRLCGEVGTLFHTLWGCPHLHLLWSQIERLVSTIIGHRQVLTPDMALLSLGLQGIPQPYRVVVSNILLSSRLVILRHWKAPVAPGLSEIIQSIQTCGTYEVLHSSALGSWDSASRAWEPWFKWYRKGAIL